MDMRSSIGLNKTIDDVLDITKQSRGDFVHDGNSRLYHLPTCAVMNESFYKGKNMLVEAPNQKYFYRCMSSEEAYVWLTWINYDDRIAVEQCLLNIENPLCLASYAKYAYKYASSGSVVMEFCAPGFASLVFDAEKTAGKICGLILENGDWSWGLGANSQMSRDANKTKELIKQLPYLFRSRVKNKGSFKVVAYKD